MGCSGCRRNKNYNSSPVFAKKQIEKIKKEIPKVSEEISNLRKKKCSKCLFNTGVGLSGRCKKCNRTIQKLINDLYFKCPIKKF